MLAAVFALAMVVDGPPQTRPGPSDSAPADSEPSGVADLGDDDAMAGGSMSAVIAACRTEWAAQTVPLRSARRALAQWRVHVEAMNRLVAGEITLELASAFWARTRVGAARRVERFEAAAGALAATSALCRRAATDTGTAAEERTLGSCVVGNRARSQVLAAAETSVGTWRHHIHDMELFRTGRLSAEQATQMWEESWRSGLAELEAYDAAARRAARQPAC